MKGFCPDCVEKQKVKGMEMHCCVVCALRIHINLPDSKITKDEHGTTHIDLTQAFGPRLAEENGNKR